MVAKKCPDCDSAMTEIRVIDKAYHPSQTALEYAAGDAKRGKWLGNFAIAGEIKSFMCDKCGRVLLYAKPNEQ